MSSLVRVSRLCGRVPLVLGLGVAVLGIAMGALGSSLGLPWVETAAVPLAHLGVGTLAIVSVCSLIGFVALATQGLNRTPTSTRGAGVPWRSMLRMAALVLAGLAAAVLLWTMTGSLTSRRIYGLGAVSDDGRRSTVWDYTVLVHNRTKETLTQPRIVGCGNDIDLGTLDPGEWDVRWLRIRQAGIIEFTAEGPGSSYAVIVDELESFSWDDRTTVTLHPDGKITLQPFEIW